MSQVCLLVVVVVGGCYIARLSAGGGSDGDGVDVGVVGTRQHSI